MMIARRLGVAAALVPLFVLALGGPVLAEVTQPGIYREAWAANEECAGGTCTRTNVFAYHYRDGSAKVCATVSLLSAEFNATSEFTGCTDVLPSAFTLRSGFILGIAQTSVDIVDHIGSGGTYTVLIGASLRTTGNVLANTYKTQETDGTCSYAVTTTTKQVDVAGTITLDGSALDVNHAGYAFTSETKVRAKCPR